jgi:hypothetical protein
MSCDTHAYMKMNEWKIVCIAVVILHHSSILKEASYLTSAGTRKCDRASLVLHGFIKMQTNHISGSSHLCKGDNTHETE